MFLVPAPRILIQEFEFTFWLTCEKNHVFPYLRKTGNETFYSVTIIIILIFEQQKDMGKYKNKSSSSFIFLYSFIVYVISFLFFERTKEVSN